MRRRVIARSACPTAAAAANAVRIHDRHQFEVVCYSDVARPDGFTKHLMTKVERWVTT